VVLAPVRLNCQEVLNVVLPLDTLNDPIKVTYLCSENKEENNVLLLPTLSDFRVRYWFRALYTKLTVPCLASRIALPV